MSEWKAITDPRTGETYYSLLHASGLPLYVWPKKDYVTAYAVFATDYGAIDTVYRLPGQPETHIPAGTAHYLEHKLFENEDCDAFERFARTGANANAYTSFDVTAYLFSCSRNLTESLEILLDFAQDPYFTEQTVEKERGIIGQEIRMGEDSPGRVVFMNLLGGLYHRHPVRIDIAGTVDSIAQITPEILYGCYNSFYDLHNRVLAVAGNVTCEQVEAVADRLLRPSQGAKPERAPVDEPLESKLPRVETEMPVAAPLFYLGYKVPMNTQTGLRRLTAPEVASAIVLEELLGGQANPLYARLMREGLINTSFGVELFDGPGFATWIIGGESNDPDAVCAAFREEVARLRRDGIAAEEFEAARNAVYGRLLSQSDAVETCTDVLLDAHFGGYTPFAVTDEVAHLTPAAVHDRLLRDFNEAASTVSVVRPLQKG